jgi:hypothetical protein
MKKIQKKITTSFKENVQIPVSMTTKQVCIWSAFWKHGWILLKRGMQVSIGHCIIENENRVIGRSKIPQECKNGGFGRQGDTYVFVGRPSNLVIFQKCG